MRCELGDALFGLATQGVGLTPDQHERLRDTLDTLLASFISVPGEARDARVGDFNRMVLAPLRRAVRDERLGAKREQVLGRLAVRQYHIRTWIATFSDYAALATAFERPQVAELQQVSGARHQFYVIGMGSGTRKQLMYDLTARIVDAAELPVNLIIVSTWARTGWNVITPNLLIDATATRDVTAWQLLRGRAMRALRTWDNSCYRLVLLLLSARALGARDDSRGASNVKSRAVLAW